MSDASWNWTIAVGILLPLILLALVVSLMPRRGNPMLIKNRDANRFNPGCFKVGGDCK